MYVYYDTFILFTSEIRVCMATAWVAAEGPWATGIAAPSSTPARRSSASRSALCSFAPQAPLRTRTVSPPFPAVEGSNASNDWLCIRTGGKNWTKNLEIFKDSGESYQGVEGLQKNLRRFAENFRFA